MKTDAELIALLSGTIGMQDFSCAINLCHLLMDCANVTGDVVEFGCHKGDMAKLMTAITSKLVYVFDSFEGLPEPTKGDTGHHVNYHKGAMACSADDLVENFDKDNLTLPRISHSWFSQVPKYMVPYHIAFAHIDSDLAESTLDALMLVYPRLSPEAICVIHDYGWACLPGVKKAVDEFLFNKPEKAKLLPTVAGIGSKQAFFKKIPPC